MIQRNPLYMKFEEKGKYRNLKAKVDNKLDKDLLFR